MEPASTGLAKIIADLAARLPLEEAVLLAWPVVCGSTVAANTRPVGFSDGVLRVETPSQVWQQQLAELAPRYLAGFARVLGRGKVERVEFVIGNL